MIGYVIFIYSMAMAVTCISYDSMARAMGWPVGEILSKDDSFPKIAAFITALWVLGKSFMIFNWWSPIVILITGWLLAFALTMVLRKNVQFICILGIFPAFVFTILYIPEQKSLEIMQILGFIVFLNVSHLGVMQIFRLTTYHAYFWKAIPLLILYGAGVAWALFALEMHPFFLWQLILASILLFVIGRKQTKMTETMLLMAGEDADLVRSMAALPWWRAITLNFVGEDADLVRSMTASTRRDILCALGVDTDLVRSMAASTAKTSRYYTYSSFVYVAVFSGTYIWLYNT